MRLMSVLGCFQIHAVLRQYGVHKRLERVLRAIYEYGDGSNGFIGGHSFVVLIVVDDDALCHFLANSACGTTFDKQKVLLGVVHYPSLRQRFKIDGGLT